MRFAGFTPVDAPDPLEGVREQVRELGIDIAGFVPQRHLEPLGATGLTSSRSGRIGQEQVVHQALVASGYTLWRNPDDRDDPVNLVEVDENTRRMREFAMSLPQPPWKKRMIEQVRHPMLTDAVHTNWTAPGTRQTTLADDLVRHVNYVLNNHFRDVYAPDPRPERHEWPDVVSVDDIEHGHPVEVDGIARDGIRLDGNPHVVGLGARLDEQRTLTVVVDREQLALIELAFVSAAPVAP